MAGIEQSSFIRVAVLLVDCIVQATDGADTAEEAMKPIQDVAKSDPTLRDALRVSIREFLRFQEPGYEGYRDYALVLLGPLDKKLAKRLYRRCIVQVAIHTLLGTQVLTEGQSFPERRKEAVKILEEVMASKQAADRITAFCLMLDLE